MRNKQNAFIIILSLSISFTFSNILITFISFETSTDSFHQNKENIYRLYSDDPFEQGRQLRYIQADMSLHLVENYAEVDRVCRVTALNRNGNTLSQEDKTIPDQLILAVDSSFFEFFDYPFLEGNKKTAIVKDGIVLKEKLAKKLFDNPPYTDKIVTISKGKETQDVKVTAVLKVFDENTQLKFDAITSGLEAGGGSVFVMLQNTANPEQLAHKISESSTTPSLVGPGKSRYELEPITSTYYNSSNVQPYDKHRNKQLITICLVVVILLSFTASFNFINLYVVGLLTRRREIGIKRVFGISKMNMILSIGLEVGIYLLISFFLSLAFTYYLLPFFNATLTTQITFSYFTYINVFLLIIGVMLIIALFITIYLVIFTWKLNPIGLINDKLGHKLKANKFMFTIQFFISVGLVIFAFVVINQMQYIKNKPLGFNKHLLQLRIEDDQKLTLHVLKESLLSYPQISNISMSSGNPISGNAIVRLELEDQKIFSPFLISGDENLVKTMGLNIIEGSDIRAEDKLGRLVNESLIKELGLKNPIGKRIPGSEGHIIGVVEDFNSRSLRQEIPPYILSYSNDNTFLLIDISKADHLPTINLVKKEWRKIYPDIPISYKLIEDELMARHKEDALFFQMIISFTLASLIISCFGLYGIVSFTCSRRIKEIGIRKVLGASHKSIILLVWKDYVKLILISFMLAVPVVNYFITDWLQEFAYRIDLSWWLYGIPGLIILIIALLTISGQSIKAAGANAAISLKNE